MKKEKWVDIPGYEGFYKISDHGRLKSVRSKKILPAHNCGGAGYRGNVLFKNGRKTMRHFRRHTLVLIAFRGPCPDGMEGCHLNGNASDNRLSNLQWVTHKENCVHRISHGTQIMGETHPHSQLDNETVIEIKKILAKKKKGFPPYQKDIAKRFGVARKVISRISLVETWQHIKLAE